MSYKQTRSWNVDKWKGEEPVPPDIIKAGLCINDGEAIAFPTETVYGLGADATNDEAVDKIFTAKGRPGDNPLIVHIGKLEQWEGLISYVPNLARTLASSFWPGPLTLVVPKTQTVSEKVTAGLSTVAVRMPDHAVARALINAAGVPVAAPSANRSGRPSPTKAEHVQYDLDGRIAGILNGGDAGFGLESTVVDCTGEKAVILRPGGITKEELESVLGENQVQQAGKSNEAQSPKAPGMKYRHYAPSSPLILINEHMEEYIEKEQQAGKSVAVLAVEENKKKFHPLADLFISLGSVECLEDIAAHLYHNLRVADQSKVDVIFCETFSKKEIGAAIMNRLEKAAGS